MRDFLVIGGGSAGCVLAAELARRNAGSVMVLEAGPSDVHPLVAMPFGLIWLMRSGRDWRLQGTATQGRDIAVPRGRMLGGSGSINSMVWFRGRADDFDGWNLPGWSYADVTPAFDAIEDRLKPQKLEHAHPLAQALNGLFGPDEVSPEHESAGVTRHNMRAGRRMSSARGFLRAAKDVLVQTGIQVDRILWSGTRATGVLTTDGTEIRAAKGVILCAGSIASPAILMRSGIGPRADLAALGIDTRIDAPDIGQNLQDHPGCGLHFEGPGSGYGLEMAQWPHWALAPLRYALTRSGPLASPTVEGAAFFNAREPSGIPDVQSHFIPFHLAHEGPRFQRKSGYFADICVCRPKSRGALTLASKDPEAPPRIDLGLFRHEDDLDTLSAGLERLRGVLNDADFGPRRAPEVHPGPAVTGDALKAHVRRSAGTAYHPVGTLAMGGPVSARLRVEGTDGLWAADASVMPRLTSANTNAPSMMIGWKGAQFITEDAA